MLAKFAPVVNFTNILKAAFPPISFSQKNKNVNCKYREAALINNEVVTLEAL